MLRSTPRKPPPETCGQCELSFDLHEEQTKNLICCVRTRTHHHRHEPLCPWYANCLYTDFQIELAAKVIPWQKAIAIQALKPPADLDTLVNIITGEAGKDLARVEDQNHQNQHRPHDAPNKNTNHGGH